MSFYRNTNKVIKCKKTQVKVKDLKKTKKSEQNIEINMEKSRITLLKSIREKQIVDREKMSSNNHPYIYFKNKPEIIMDAKTCLLWINPKYNVKVLQKYNKFINPSIKLSSNMVIQYLKGTRYSLKKFNINEIDNWTYPNEEKIKKSIPVRTTNYGIYYFNERRKINKIDSNMFIGDYPKTSKVKYSFVNYKGAFFVESLGRSEKFPNTIYLLMPVNKKYWSQSYEDSIREDNKRFTENEKAEKLLKVFLENGLVPDFEEEELNEIYDCLFGNNLNKENKFNTNLNESKKVTELNTDLNEYLEKYGNDNNITPITFYENIIKFTSEVLHNINLYKETNKNVLEKLEKKQFIFASTP